MQLGRMTSNYLIMRICTNQTTSWLVHSFSTFGARTSHEQPQAHKTHHGPNLREATTFPFIVRLFTGATSKWHFVPGLPSASPGIRTVGIPTTLKAHNFACRPSISITSETKLEPSSRAFQWYVASCMHARKSNRFLTFSGQESNCQFDF
jgi:hypothetical protein